MVKYSTVGHRFSPARSKKKRSRRKSRRSRYSEESNAKPKCVTITLRDVGDIDDKELNTIPSSVEGENSSWGEKLMDKSNSLSSCTNPNLQVQRVDYCAECTKKLLDIHQNDSGRAGEKCEHEGIEYDVRRKTVAQSLMKVFQSITEGRFDESKIEIVQSKSSDEKGHENDSIHKKIMEKKCRAISRAKKASSKEVRCSLSTVSIQVMCTSESTLSTGISRGLNQMVLGPPETTPKPEPMISKKKLETVAGALLIELCKATAEKMNEIPVANQKKIMLAKDSYMPRIMNARHGRPSTGYSALDARLPDWLRELCQEEDPRKRRRGILKKTRSQMVKSKISIFRPLVCTKLSLPWFLPKSLPQITCKRQHQFDTLKHKSSSDVKYAKPHHRNNTDRKRYKEDNSEESVRGPRNVSNPEHRIVHAYNSRSVHYRASDSIVPFDEPAPPADVPLRLFSSKMVREVKLKKKKLPKLREDSTEDKDSRSISRQDGLNSTGVKEKRIKDICPKCHSSIQCSIAIKSNPPKLRRIKTKAHNVLAYPCKKVVKKTKPTSRQEKSRRQQHDKLRESDKARQYNGEPTTKYFIKSFFTGTTSTSETTKSPLKNAKKLGRRKKTYAPRRTSAGRTVEVDRRRPSPARSPRKRAEKTSKKDESQSEIELEIQASEEMDIINEHIRAHKTASGSSPVFHTCFKRLVDKELKAQSGRDSKTSKSKKPSKGGHFLGRSQVEVKKFNEGIFSCLIPKVFK